MRFLLAILATFLFVTACPAADPDLGATMYQLNQQRFYLMDKEKNLSREYGELANRAQAIKLQIQQLGQELDATQTRMQEVKHSLISVQLQLR